MNTGDVCGRCAGLLTDRRQRRAHVAGQVRVELPDADSQTRRRTTEHWLREVVTAELVRVELRCWETAEAEVFRAATAQRVRAEAEAADEARRAGCVSGVVRRRRAGCARCVAMGRPWRITWTKRCSARPLPPSASTIRPQGKPTANSGRESAEENICIT